MKAITKILLAVSLITLINSQGILAQTISGPDTVCQGSSAVYTCSAALGESFIWSSVLGYPALSLQASTMVTFVNHGSGGLVQVTVLDSNGLTIGNYQKNVVVIKPPRPHIVSDAELMCQNQIFETFALDSALCRAVCDSSIVNYQTALTAGSTYFWEVSGSLFDTSSGNQLEVVWDTIPGFGFVRVTETDSFGCSSSYEMCIEIVTRPKIDTAFGPQTSCIDENLSFLKHVISTGAVKYFWDFGDGLTSIDKDPDHIYDTTGVFTVKLIIENECGCKDSLLTEVTVDEDRSPEVYCISTVCQGESHVYAIPADTAGNYYWNNITGLLNPVTAGQNSASATIQWLGCDINGYGILNVYESGVSTCDQSHYIPIITSIGSWIEGPQIVCARSQHVYTMPPVPGSKFHWQVTGGTFAYNGSTSYYGQDLREVAINWDSTTPGEIQVNFFNYTLGCGDSLSLSVDILNEFTMSGPVRGCENTSYTFNLSALFGGNFSWEIYKLGSGVVYPLAAGADSLNYTFTSGGQFEVRAFDTSGAYCNKVFRHRIIVNEVAAAPPIPIGDTLVCKDAYYLYQSSPFSNDYFLEWDINGGTPSSSNSNALTVNWNTAGPAYSITLFNISKDSPYCRSDSTFLEIDRIGSSDIIPAFTRDAEVCANSITYHGVTNIINIEYDHAEWTLTPPYIGSIISGQGTNNITVQWTNSVAAGYMSFIGVVCGDTVGDTIWQHTFINPDISVYGGGSSCPDSVFTFTKNSSSEVYVTEKNWFFGDGTSDTTSAPGILHNYSDPGKYFIRLEVTYGGYCPEVKTSNILTVLIHEPPVAKLSSDTAPEFCPIDSPATINLLLTGQGLNSSSQYGYTWYRGVSTFSPTSAPFKHTITSPGPPNLALYQVRVIDNSTGCITFTESLSVDSCLEGGGIGGDSACSQGNVELDFTFSVDSIDCGIVTITPLPSGSDLDVIMGYSYNYGDGSSGSSNMHTYQKAGFYKVTLTMNFTTDNDDTCLIVFKDAVKVPVFAAFEHYLQCDTGSNMLVKVTGLGSWVEDSLTSTVWTPSGSGNNPTFSLSAGNHAITMQVTSAGGSCQYTDTISVPERAEADFGIQPGPYCEQTPILFSDSSSGDIYRWFWNHGDSTTALIQNSSRVFNDQIPGLINVFPKLVVNDIYGCSDSINKSIIIRNNGLGNSLIFLTGTNPFCFSDSVELSTINKGTSSPFYHLWSNTQTSSSIFIKNTGKFMATITDGFNCTYKTPPQYTGVYYTPTSAPRGLTQYCPGDLVELDMFTGVAYDYEWLRNGTTAGDSSYLGYIAGSGPSIDSILAVVSDANCSDTTVMAITILQPPVISGFSTSPNDCEAFSPTITASVSGSGLSYNWSNGENSNPIVVNSAGMYRLTLTNAVGCDTSAETEIHAAPDFSTLMTGCYDFCLSDTPEIVIQGLNPAYFDHQWLEYSTGGEVVYSTADTLVLDSAGNYQFRLLATNINSAGCSDTSDMIEIDLWHCEECGSYSGIASINEISCLERDSSYIWDYGFEVVILNTYPGTVTITPEYGIVSQVSSNILTNQYDTITGVFTPFIVNEDSICLTLEMINMLFGKCEFRICDTLPTCHMPCKIDSIFNDSISCIGVDEHGANIYYFESRIYNAGTDYLQLHASLDSTPIVGLSLDSLSPGMNNVTGYIHTSDSGYQCISFGFYSAPDGEDEGRCCRQEHCILLPSCPEPEQCSEFSADSWMINCVGTVGGHSVYSFSMNLTNGNASSFTYSYGSPGGYLYGLSPSLIASGPNTLSGYFVNLSDTSVICIHLVMTDEDGNICVYDFCSDPPLMECEGANPCDWSVNETTLSCDGSDGEAGKYYTFSLGIVNTGLAGYVYSSSGSLWIDPPSVIGTGSVTLDGGFYLSSPTVPACFDLFVLDTNTQNICHEEICFDELPECCDEILERKRKEEKPGPENASAEPRGLLHIYPNPTSDLVNISYQIEPNEVATLVISDVFGSPVTEYRGLKGSASINMSVEGYRGGLYFVSLRSSGRILAWSKLVIVR